MWYYSIEEAETQNPPMNNIQVLSMVAETDYSCYGWGDDDLGSSFKCESGEENMNDVCETHAV